MTLKEVMAELKKLGTAQNVKVYRRHGAGDNLFGVSFANLYKLQKKIRVDHELAGQLWKTGNADAQILAMLIADPKRVSARELEEWVKGSGFHGVVGYVAAVAAKSPHAARKMVQWTKSSADLVGSAGWTILGSMAMENLDLPDSFFEPYLSIIESGIHKAKNRTRYSMNNALIGIGSRSDGLEKRALAVAKTIGKVEVDHGETGCKTPDAVSYIPKSRAYHKTRQAKKKQKAA